MPRASLWELDPIIELRDVRICRSRRPYADHWPTIYQSASTGNILEGFAHNISDFVWDHLHVCPNLLAGSTNSYRTDKRERFRI